MRPRTLGAALLTASAAFLLLVEAVSWSRSARFGPLSSTTLPCAIRLDTLSAQDRASGLREGDLVALSAMDVPSRTAGVFHYTPTQAGTAGETIGVAIERGTQTTSVPYVLRHVDPPSTFVAQLAFKLIAFGIAMLLLWRGADFASAILGGWCLALSVGLPDAWWGGLPLGARVAGGTLTAVLWTTAPFLLYLVVEAVATGVSLRERIVARIAMIAMLLPALLVNSVDATAQALRGCWILPSAPWFANAMFVASQLVIVGFFALSYARTKGLAKQRVRWVFWAFIFSRFGVLLNLLNRLTVHPVHLSGLEWATVLIFPIGCTYAILRHRIINVNFVLNRTLVYTILTTIVVGTFIVIEDGLGKMAAARGVGIAIDVGVALLLGFSFNALHKQVEGAIERALFRQKHEAANALRQLAEEAPFMENASALVRRTVSDVCTYSGATGTAVYERIDDHYEMTSASGDKGFPREVDADDLAFVRLRKSRGSLSLEEVNSALGKNGVAFALAVRGQLSGALVCRRRRDGEAYAPDEIALLAAIAHEVGAELHAIRAREQAELLNKLLSGSLDIQQVRERIKG